MTTLLIISRNFSKFKNIENGSNVMPFSWIHKYVFRKDIYYNWNIFVPKMFKLLIEAKEVPHEK